MLGPLSRQSVSAVDAFLCGSLRVFQTLGRRPARPGWANQSNERGWHGQTVQKPCKSYYSSVYIDTGTRVIAFCGAKPCKKSYSSMPYINIHPVRIAFCGAKPSNVPGFGSTPPSSMLYVLYVLSQEDMMM